MSPYLPPPTWSHITTKYCTLNPWSRWASRYPQLPLNIPRRQPQMPKLNNLVHCTSHTNLLRIWLVVTKLANCTHIHEHQS